MIKNQSTHSDSSRAVYFMNAVTDFKNNKSRRVQNENGEVVKSFRKWLGSIKYSLGNKVGDLSLRVTLDDL